jgi:nicotinic acid mononucleotide adenylyltransferase
MNKRIKKKINKRFGISHYNDFKRPITMLELFMKERKLRKIKILNLKRKHRTYTINS